MPIRHKRFRGQATLEFLSIVPVMLLFFSMLGFTGWWTYGRMNGISVAYLDTLVFSSFQNNYLSFTDSSILQIQQWSSGNPYWYAITVDISSFGDVSASEKVTTPFNLKGIVVPNKTDLLFGNEMINKYGAPHSTVTGMFCLFCSADRYVSP
jgi:hypothetical protein